MLKNLAIERRRYDVGSGRTTTLFRGSKLSYFGVKDSYWNGVEYIEDDGSVNEWLPRKVFDNSVGNGFWAPDEYLLEDLTFLMDPTGGAGSYRENMVTAGFTSFHNWRATKE